MTTVPATVLAALVLNSSEDASAARERATVLATAAKLAPFTTEEAESHLFRRFGGHAMTDTDRRAVAQWMAAL